MLQAVDAGCWCCVCLEADATLVQCLWAAGVCVHPAPRLWLPAQAAAAPRQQEMRACVRGKRRCASVVVLNSGLGLFFLPDQKFIVALNQAAHKAF